MLLVMFDPRHQQSFVTQSHFLEPDWCVCILAATLGTSAASAPAGSADCAALTASSSAQNAPGEEELLPVDLHFAFEAMIWEIRRSLPERSPSVQVTLLDRDERGWTETS